MKKEDLIINIVQIAIKDKEEHFIDIELTKSEINKILKATGINLEGYKRVITTSDVRHVIKKHGINSSDRTPINYEDFALIPLITSSPDRISISNISSKMNDLKIIVFEKIIVDKYYYLEEIRVGRKKVSLKTFYKNPIKKGNK